MNIKPVFFAFAVASATVAMTGAANAFGITIGPGGVQVNPGYYYDYDNHHYDNWGISADQAVRIARDNGVRHVDDVQRHRNTYEVSGQTRHHRYITVTIDRGNGRVLDVSR
jgi:hypothetical protein